MFNYYYYLLSIMMYCSEHKQYLSLMAVTKKIIPLLFVAIAHVARCTAGVNITTSIGVPFNIDFEHDDDYYYNDDQAPLPWLEDDDHDEEFSWVVQRTTIDEFVVNGVNLAQYRNTATKANNNRMNTTANTGLEQKPKTKPFLLYEDFDIHHLIKGHENWQELLTYRKNIQKPSLSFYVDKVARKRWLPEQGYDQAKVFLLHYANELNSIIEDEENEVAGWITNRLPRNASFCAKPTHSSELRGNWLVDPSEKVVSTDGTVLREEEALSKAPHYFTSIINTACGTSLARSLKVPPAKYESWALKNVNPGIVVEEKWSHYSDLNAPPEEFNMFVIWGRVWLVQWNAVEGQHRYHYAFILRNGTDSYRPNKRPPQYLPWNDMIRIAEELGAHKDIFRVDLFFGIPTDQGRNMTKNERLANSRIVVNECEIFPTTIFPDKWLADEGARLWRAGYRIGNYKVVENSEVPSNYKEIGVLKNRLTD